jgi:quercetin dioxygenase-like cupin family protein
MQLWAWESIKNEVVNDKLWRKLVTGEKVMVAHLRLFKDCFVPVHHHESEQISLIMEGALKFELEGREITARAGDVLVIPSNVPHSALALEDTVGIDVFSPIRQDWLDGSDTYLRKK